jgi:hypothetical protein
MRTSIPKWVFINRFRLVQRQILFFLSDYDVISGAVKLYRTIQSDPYSRIESSELQITTFIASYCQRWFLSGVVATVAETVEPPMLALFCRHVA